MYIDPHFLRNFLQTFTKAKYNKIELNTMITN